MKPSNSSNTNNKPRYDLGLNPPYQINYRAKRAGKHISASKRRITFQFGFSSASAIRAGAIETECRGEEHEIVLIWSHMTGKRQLYMDGREIHVSKVARANTKFEYSWNVLGGHTMKMIANGTPSNKNSMQRQFDLELDGMSYFEFCKIFELGSATVNQRMGLPKALAYSYRGAAYDARDDGEEDEELPMPEVKVTTIDLFDSHPSSSLSPMTNYSSIPSMVGSITSSASASSYASYDEFLPVECSANTQQKSFDSISNEILCAYNTTAPQATDITPSSSRALVPVSEEGMDPVAKSMQYLVNLDDITTSTLRPIVRNSPSLKTMKQGHANWGLIGRAPTLSEMRDSVAPSPTMPVMNAHPTQSHYQAQHPQTGMMYQQAQPSSQQQGAGTPYYGYGAPNMGYAQAY